MSTPNKTLQAQALFPKVLDATYKKSLPSHLRDLNKDVISLNLLPNKTVVRKKGLIFPKHFLETSRTLAEKCREKRLKQHNPGC